MDRIDKAVIMARGLGTRMRKADESASLSKDQLAVAGAGIKAMIPIGRPFLDYVLSGLADAGFSRVCLIIGPEHQIIRDYYQVQSPPRRIQIDFAVQQEPLGTADAVLAAKSFVGNESFLVINSDNHYPVPVLRAMRAVGKAGIALFDRDRLVAESNIPEDRVLKFALAKVSPDGYLERILEKPTQAVVRELSLPLYVSMNCWVFSPVIFRACRSIRPSARGELELTDAVQFAIDSLDEHFKVLHCQGAVLDMSSRSDIAVVAEKLKGVHPNP
ncbi:MAG: nucleotidyltransferase family protein [Acidobacteria bacterium]|nr:nucleotidyltransferase family protein [Acidobacteriota bacterium]